MASGPPGCSTISGRMTLDSHTRELAATVPSMTQRRPTAQVVLSIALGRHDPSTRFKEVVHPAPAHWMHHLEIHDAGDIDDEVVGWFREAADRST